MKTEIELLGRVPSKKNSKRQIYRGGKMFMVPSKNHEEWHEEQTWYLHSLKLSKRVNIKKVSLYFHAPDKRKADLTNKAESIMDLLVDNGVINDDSWFDVPVVHLELIDVDKIRPRVKIIIEHEKETSSS